MQPGPSTANLRRQPMAVSPVQERLLLRPGLIDELEAPLRPQVRAVPLPEHRVVEFLLLAVEVELRPPLAAGLVVKMHAAPINPGNSGGASGITDWG